MTISLLGYKRGCIEKVEKNNHKIGEVAGLLATSIRTSTRDQIYVPKST